MLHHRRSMRRSWIGAANALSNQRRAIGWRDHSDLAIVRPGDSPIRTAAVTVASICPGCRRGAVTRPATAAVDECDLRGRGALLLGTGMMARNRKG